MAVKNSPADEPLPLLILPIPVEHSTLEEVTNASGLSLSELQTTALQNNPSLTVAAARWNAARGKQFQAGRYPNPVAGYHATEVGNLGTAGSQGGFVSQRFVTGGKLELDQAAAGETVREHDYLYRAQERRIMTDVTIRFYEALSAQKKVELTEQLVSIGDDLVRSTEKLLEALQSSENDLLQAQIRADQAEILFDNARNQSEETWRRLMVVVGTPTMQVTPLHGQLHPTGEELDWERCYASVLASHPDLNAARARAEQARILISRAHQEPIPNVDLFVSMRHNNLTDSDVANVQIGVPIPVFNKNRGNIRAADANWIAACHDIKRIELALQDQLAVAFRRYANALQQQQKYQDKILPRAARSLALVRKGYDNGQVEYLTLLTSLETYVQASLTHLDALRELQSAKALLEGQLLSSSLQMR